jgi:hypothetical protein
MRNYCHPPGSPSRPYATAGMIAGMADRKWRRLSVLLTLLTVIVTFAVRLAERLNVGLIGYLGYVSIGLVCTAIFWRIGNWDVPDETDDPK